MFSNPFFVGKPILSQDDFVGRGDIKQRILGGLNPNLNSTNVIGERRTGKTSLMLEIQRQLHEIKGTKPFLATYIDCSQTENVESFWREFVSNLKLEVSGQTAQIVKQIETLFPPNKLDINTLAAQIIKTISLTNNVVILLDEFDFILESEHFSGTFLLNLRHLGSFNVGFVVATRRRFEFHTTISSPFFNIFTFAILGLFPEKEARDLLNKKQPDGKSSAFNEEELRYILDVSGGYPVFLQLAAKEMFTIKYGDIDVTNKNWHDKHLELFEQTARQHFDYFWSKCSNQEKECLLALSKGKKLPEKMNDVKQILFERSLIIDRGGEIQPFSPIWAKWILNQSREKEKQAPEPIHKLMPNVQALRPKTSMTSQINVYAEQAVIGSTMNDNKEITRGNKTTFSNASGSIINIDSMLEQVTQNIDSTHSLNESDKKNLLELIDQLKIELLKTPPAKKEEAEALAESAKTLVEAGTKAQPNRTTIQITAEGLKKAAENMAEVMPTVITIASSIVKMVFRFVGIPLP